MKDIKPLLISGKEVYPLVEGGKGVAVTNGRSSGAWAAAGGVGTISAVNADFYDETGALANQVYKGRTRSERHRELIDFGIKGGIVQARIAHEEARGEGRMHINVLWEMGGAREVLEGVLEGAKGLIHGVTCGAGMPYGVAEIAARHRVYYYPIVSSARAFRALWKRAYSKAPEWLGGVVYEDPWLAGGHNGLSNSENPREPQPPLPRVAELRAQMRAVGAPEVPIVMAGGVWYLREWAEWLENPELGPIAFQFGTRPLLTEESPISDEWKQRLLTLRPGDVLLHRFSPTGFYSSAVRNDFLQELVERSNRQITYFTEPQGQHTTSFAVGPRAREVFVRAEDSVLAHAWVGQGFTEAMRTPDSSLIFVTPERAERIKTDQINCMGCLSACGFSNWAENELTNTGKRADPRSFCIQKTLQEIAHGYPVDQNLMFAGHNAFRFATDPFFTSGRIPTMGELVERILTGD
ncbi:nitronate monooxygenase [Rhodospirillum rubrum]|uniref:NAD(P)H-dependent flavin oxidoreductase n=1 Tax=Rhodospirillum rubrum TaxID=1085 RepID=UPI0019057A9C|nr:nitronate monooxygenase [Rhodospirillum rubrum]MBK1664683.1 nitronate monooxygenase [Rhodospirillum rubrum]MBK1677587.1 nitronate monooxygenase [Rhodospirillum rubrum]